MWQESEYPWRDYEIEYEPTGRLYLEIESWSPGRSKWADGKKQRVENVLGDLARAGERFGRTTRGNPSAQRSEGARRSSHPGAKMSC